MGQARTVSLAIAATLVVTAAWAQDAKSAAGARELAGLLVQKKLDAVAARDPAAPDAFVAALHFPGQLLIISARYTVPPLLNEKLARREYRDVYIELNAASVAESRVFVTDIGADGLNVEAGQARWPGRPARQRRQAVPLRRQLAGRQDVGGRLHEGVRRGRRPGTPRSSPCSSPKRRSSGAGRHVDQQDVAPGADVGRCLDARRISRTGRRPPTPDARRPSCTSRPSRCGRRPRQDRPSA